MARTFTWWRLRSAELVGHCASREERSLDARAGKRVAGQNRPGASSMNGAGSTVFGVA